MTFCIDAISADILIGFLVGSVQDYFFKPIGKGSYKFYCLLVRKKDVLGLSCHIRFYSFTPYLEWFYAELPII